MLFAVRCLVSVARCFVPVDVLFVVCCVACCLLFLVFVGYCWLLLLLFGDCGLLRIVV